MSSGVQIASVCRLLRRGQAECRGQNQARYHGRQATADRGYSARRRIGAHSDTRDPPYRTVPSSCWLDQVCSVSSRPRSRAVFRPRACGLSSSHCPWGNPSKYTPSTEVVGSDSRAGEIIPYANIRPAPAVYTSFAMSRRSRPATNNEAESAGPVRLHPRMSSARSDTARHVEKVGNRRNVSRRRSSAAVL